MTVSSTFVHILSIRGHLNFLSINKNIKHNKW